jgi:hypothetical protein
MVYIIDQGFNVYHNEFRSDCGRRLVTYVVPTEITLANFPKSQWPAPNEFKDYSGHGTHVASVAIGKKYGFAPNANFALVKMEQAILDPEIGSPQYVHATPASVKDAWKFVIQDEISRRQSGDTGKSIVTMNIGTLIISVSLRRSSLANTGQGFYGPPEDGRSGRVYLD